MTSKEQCGLFNKKVVKDGAIDYKIAAHTANLTKGQAGAQFREFTDQGSELYANALATPDNEPFYATRLDYP